MPLTPMSIRRSLSSGSRLNQRKTRGKDKPQQQNSKNAIFATPAGANSISTHRLNRFYYRQQAKHQAQHTGPTANQTFPTPGQGQEEQAPANNNQNATTAADSSKGAPPMGPLFTRKPNRARTPPRIRNLLASNSLARTNAKARADAKNNPVATPTSASPKTRDSGSMPDEVDMPTPATVTAPKPEPYVSPQFHYTDAQGGNVVFPNQQQLQMAQQRQLHQALGPMSPKPRQRSMTSSSLSTTIANNTLFTFRRQYDANTVRETTVQAHLTPRHNHNDDKSSQAGSSVGGGNNGATNNNNGPTTTTTPDTEANTSASGGTAVGDTMEDLVKRLQSQGTKQVFVFTKEEATAIACGEKRIVFSLVQVPNARFSKEEFGSMTAASVLQLTDERPVVVELLAEDVIQGESVTVF